MVNFEEYAFATAAAQTTLVVDLSTSPNILFLDKNLPFIAQLSKQNGINWEIVPLGVITGRLDLGGVPSPFGETVSIASVKLLINESSNIFTFNDLEPETTYKLNVIQKKI